MHVPELSSFCFILISNSKLQFYQLDYHYRLLSYGLFQSTYIPVICEITDAKHESLPLPVNIVES